ncbi:hypothetical protein [Paenibacillus sp. FSL R7-0272]|uniref:hypothetical protein n=1 Tax=Paenibacillus sp. FSL R7-0272 TaxID=2921679 RepID=UPI0030EC08C8
MKMILNERQHAEEALEYGKMDKKPTKTLVCIAKLCLEEGKSKSDTYNVLHEFMAKSYPNYNTVHWESFFYRIIHQATRYIKTREERGKKSLIEIEHVSITHKELNQIRELRSKRLEKLAFVLLVYSKINNQIHENNLYWINHAWSEIYSDTGMAVSKKDQGLLVYKLIHSGLLKESRRFDSTSVQVLFAHPEDAIAIGLTRFDDFILEYLRWTGETVKDCSVCGKRVLAKSNRLKYCKNCKKKLGK